MTDKIKNDGRNGAPPPSDGIEDDGVLFLIDDDTVDEAAGVSAVDRVLDAYEPAETKPVPPPAPKFKAPPIHRESATGEAAAPPAPPAGSGTKDDPIIVPHPDGGEWIIPERKTTGFMDALVLAIITTDSDAYPDGVMGLGSGYKKRKQWYRLGKEAFIFESIMKWERNAAGLRTDDNKNLPFSEITARWRKRLSEKTVGAGDSGSRPPLGTRDDPIVIHPPDGEEWNIPRAINRDNVTVDLIDKILRSIVEQDTEMYPNGARDLTTGAEKVRRYYLFGDRRIRFGSLLGWERLADNLDHRDSKSLPQARIISRWKERIFDESEMAFKADPSKPVGSRENPLIISHPQGLKWQVPDPVTKTFIDAAVRGIVEQDRDRFPRGAAQLTGTSPDIPRHYLLGTTRLTLATLLTWERKTDGLNTNDFKVLSNREILERWKTRIFDADELRFTDPSSPYGSRYNPVIIEHPGGEEWIIPKKMTATFIDLAVRAIVEQHSENYPSGAESLSGRQRNIGTYYLLGKNLLRFGRLVQWERGISNKHSDDHRPLSLSRIIRKWRKRIFGIVPEAFIRNSTKPEGSYQNPIVITSPDGKEWDIPDTMTKDFIDRLVRAIVEQDVSTYPGGPDDLSSTQDKFVRYYLFGTERICLDRLGRWERTTDDLPGRYDAFLQRKDVVARWKKRIFDIEPEEFKPDPSKPPGSRENPIEITSPDGKTWVIPKKMTSDFIDAVIRSIVEQDTAAYPRGGFSLTGTNKRMGRYYMLGSERIYMHTIRAWERQARGIGPLDKKTLSDKSIITEWRRRIFEIEDQPMPPEEFREWIRVHRLEDVVEIFRDAPHQLLDFIRAISPDTSHHQISRIMRAFAELKLSEGWNYEGADRKIVEIGEDPFIRALLIRRQLLERMDATQLDRLVRTAKSHWLMAFNSNPEETLKVLDRIILETADPRVRSILQMTVAAFQDSTSFHSSYVRTALFPFQMEGAKFLAERTAAILADEPGMGKTIQAIAAAEFLRENGKLFAKGRVGKVLIIAPASVKNTWQTQLSTNRQYGHLGTGRKTVVIEGSREKRRRLAMESRDADYVIVNYEYLISATPEELEAITSGLSIKIVDEAQMIQNPSDEVKRAAAVRAIDAHRTWYLTATPYFAHVEHIWTHLNDLEPGKHGTLQEFRNAHAGDETGLILLNERMKHLMLRRLKKEVVGTYDPGLPLEEQPLLLPEMNWIDPEEEGGYTMSVEQQSACMLLLTDFDSFWEEYGDSERQSEEVIPIERMEMLFRILHHPEDLGINGIEQKYEELDRIVAARIERGQKIAIHTNRLADVERLLERYKSHGAVTYIGGKTDKIKSMTEEEREAARREFQDGDANIIIGTRAMMFGIDLSAADALIFAQMPWTYSELYQMADRLHRMDPNHRKYFVDIIQMMGRYPGMSDATLEEGHYLKTGSYDELLIKHLQSGRTVFDTVMDMPRGEEYLNRVIRNNLGRKLFGDASGFRRRALEAGEALYPLFVAALSFDDEKSQRIQDAVVSISHLYAGETEATNALVEAYRLYLDEQEIDGEDREIIDGDVDFEDTEMAIPELPVEELEFIARFSSIGNKHLRSQLLKVLPDVIRKLHRAGLTMNGLFADSSEPSPLHMLAWLVAGGDTEQRTGARDTISGIINRIDGIVDIVEDDERRKITFDLEDGFLKLFSERETAARFLADHRHIISSIDSMEFAELVNILAAAKTASPVLFGMLTGESFSELSDLISLYRNFEVEPYVEHLVDKGEPETDMAIRAKIQKLLKDGLDGFLALAHGFTAARLTDELALLKEIFLQVVSGTFGAWRAAGAGIDYLKDDVDFWRGFNAPLSTRTKVTSDTLDMTSEIRLAHEQLIDALKEKANDSISDRLEHKFVWQKINFYLSIEDSRARAGYRSKIRQAIKAIKRFHSENGKSKIAGRDAATLQVFGLTLDSIKDSSDRKRILTVLSRLARWLDGLAAAEEGVEKGTPKGLERSLAVFTHISRGYRRRLKGEKDPLAASLIGFASLLKNRKLKMAGSDVVVEDTADWDPLLNMGRLHPELINCLVPSGNPNATKTLVDLLASRNQRMLIVRDAKSEEILSVSFVKVRKDANGNPALHLERPSGRRGAKFEDLMIDHIVQKSLKMGSAGQNATITRQARTKKEREAGITLFSTGSAATHEYIEDLYGVRKSANVQFNAHIVHGNTVSGGGGSGLSSHGSVQRFAPMTFGAGTFMGMNSGLMTPTFGAQVLI